MIEDIFVIDAVVHTYNLSPANFQPNQAAQLFGATMASAISTLQPGIENPDAEALATDWSVDINARTLFLESAVDVAVHHTLPLYSYFKDGFTSHAKTVEAVTKYPGRFLAYAAVDPTQGLQACLRQLDEQLSQTPDAIGLKLYPAQVDPTRKEGYLSWRADDLKLFPLWERAQERGIRVIAIHKAVPLGPIPMNPFRVQDVEGAATAFPDLNFEILHAGVAFAEETANVLARYPNVYANLENTCLFARVKPKYFERVMAEFVTWGGLPKIIYGDGGSLMPHSQPHLEALMGFQFSDRTCEEYGVEKLTHADKAAILGGNYARMAGLDIELLKANIADDHFSQIQRNTGLQKPYSNWKAELTKERQSRVTA